MSITFKKLGIEFTQIPQQQLEEATQNIQSSRLEQILIAECDPIEWDTILERPDLISIKQSDKWFELGQQKEEENDYSFWIFPKTGELRKILYRLCQSDFYKGFIIIITMINLLAYCWKKNRINITVEICCNIIFGFDLIVKAITFGVILNDQAYLKSLWNILNLIAFTFTWLIVLDESEVNNLLETVRILRIFRLIQDVQFLQIQFTAYVSSFLKLRQVLIPIFLVMLYFSIIGLHLFSGLTEFRCRLTPQPVNNIWEADAQIQKLCGIWECPSGTYCGSPINYGLEKIEGENDLESFVWDYIRFDDIFHSLLVVFTFLNVTGWSGTTFMFWKAMTTYVTAAYFLILIILLAFILSNLLLALFYDSFMEKSSIKNSQSKINQEKQQLEEELKKKNQTQLMNRITLISKQKDFTQVPNSTFTLFFDNEYQNTTQNQKQKKFPFMHKIQKSVYLTFVNNIFILVSSVVILIDYDKMSQKLLAQLQIIDFVCILYFAFEFFMILCDQGFKEYFKKLINIFDFTIMLSQWLLCFILIALDQPLINNNNIYVIFFKSLKILRLIRFFYFLKLLYTITVLTRALITTLIKMKVILCLWIVLIFIIAILGYNLLGNFIIENNTNIHYDDFLSSLMSAVNIFYNEEWHITMYKYARHTAVSFIFYILSVIFGQVFFIRLLTAVFLNEFGKQFSQIQLALKPLSLQHIINQIKNVIINFQSNKQKHLENHQVKSQQTLMKNTMILKPNLLSPQNQNQSNISYPKLKIQTNSILKLKTKKSNENNEINRNSQMNNLRNNEENNEFINDNFEEWLQVDFPSNSQQQQQSQFNVKSNEQSNEKIKLQVTSTKLMQFRQFIKQLTETLYFRIFMTCVVLSSTIVVALKTPFLDPNSKMSEWLKIITTINTILFSSQLILNIFGHGLFQTNESYLRKSPYNILNFLITINDLISIYAPSSKLQTFITSLRILEFIKIGAEINENINYIQQALMKAFVTMIQLSIFCFIILLIYGIFATKLLKGQLYYCDLSLIQINNKWECMDYGGSWINKILGYDNIFDSVLTLFITATTEAWLPILIDTWSSRGNDLQPVNNHNRWWALYFQIYFFIGNLCMLNMFIGLVVQTYQETKIKAQGKSELTNNQREWQSIKSSITYLKPRKIQQLPKHKIFLILYHCTENKLMKIVWHSIIGINSLILALFYLRQNEQFKYTLIIVNKICLISFAAETTSKFIMVIHSFNLKDKFYIIDLIGVIISLANTFYIQNENFSFYTQRSLQGLSVLFQLLRYYYIIKRFSELQRLFGTIFSVIPSALAMIFIMFIFLFIYTSLGMDLFGYLRPQSYIDGWDLHFRKFSTAMFSLIRVASSEQWWALLVDAVHTRSPNFACIDIITYEDYIQYGYNGCGTNLAYIYFISFHLIFSLVILNLFIASILGAYEEHVKQEESAINKYQLHDVLNYWAQYDPEGTGFLNYKQFWKLSSEIAICFGVKAEELLKPENKKKFLQALNIPLYEDIQGIMGYLFHEVILSLTKISVELKYGVKDLDSQTYKEEESFSYDYKKQFKITPYTSGQMSAIIYLQGKVRTLINKKRGINFLNLEALKQELQNQSEMDKYINQK